MPAVIDHLVIAARTLAEGEAWARETFGVAPAGHGAHDAMATRNALWHLAVDAPEGHPDAYLEVIAAEDPAPRPRWFGLDDPATRKLLAEGPRLLTWQVRPPRPLTEALGALAAAGTDAGRPLPMTRAGFAWSLGIRDDGALPLAGRCPIAIEWAAASPHPAGRLAPGGLRLKALSLPDGDDRLDAALAALDAGRLATRTAPGSPLSVTLETPNGAITLAAPA